MSIAVATAPLAEHQTVTVELHGLVVQARCPIAGVLDALERRVARLPVAYGRRVDLAVEYVVGRPPLVAPDDARVIYESELGTLWYAPEDDELYAAYGSVTMRCDPEQGVAVVAVPAGRTDATWLLSRPLFTLPLMETARRRGLYPLHAACLARDGRGVIVVGPSGAGKSTLALGLAQAGFDFLGDDLVFLDVTRGVRALGFPDELGLEPATRTLFPALRSRIAAEAPQGWPKERAAVDDLVDTRVVSTCRPRVTVVLAPDAQAAGALEPAGRDDVLMELLPSVLLTRRDACAAHLEALDLLATSTAGVRLCGRADVAASARRLADLLDAEPA